MGHVESIHLAETAADPVFPVKEVRAIVGRGLEGDRIGNDAGEGAQIPGRKQVTLIEAESLEALARDYEIELEPGANRRNICTRDVALNHFVNRTFRVGDVTLRGLELCEPCATLARLVDEKGVVKGLLHRGGLRAEVVEGGMIRVGDEVRPG